MSFVWKPDLKVRVQGGSRSSSRCSLRVAFVAIVRIVRIHGPVSGLVEGFASLWDH